MRLPLIAATCLSLGLPLGLPLAPSPAAAQEDPGPSLMEEGARLFLRGLMSEAEPMIDEMGRAFADIEPALRAMGPQLQLLVGMMGDVANYEAPERLPNGDIIIRRKPGAPPPPALPEVPALPPLPGPNALDRGGEIEL